MIDLQLRHVPRPVGERHRLVFLSCGMPELVKGDVDILIFCLCQSKNRVRILRLCEQQTLQ
jgi:hypothetical protein